MMESTILNTSGNKRRLKLLASAMCISVFTVGCIEEKPVVESNDTVNKTTDVISKPAEEMVIKTEKNVDNVANEISKKVSQAKEDLKSFDIEVATKKTEETGINSSTEIIISDIYVVDGDTIHGVDQDGKKLKVRMTGIDAPESRQPMGEESAEALRQCVGMNDNAVLVVQLNNATDKYGRTLAKVESAGINCNQQQIEKGMAWFYEDYSDKLASGDKGIYKQAQDYAQENIIGIWARDLQKPWDYRKENK